MANHGRQTNQGIWKWKSELNAFLVSDLILNEQLKCFDRKSFQTFIFFFFFSLMVTVRSTVYCSYFHHQGREAVSYQRFLAYFVLLDFFHHLLEEFPVKCVSEYIFLPSFLIYASPNEVLESLQQHVTGVSWMLTWGCVLLWMMVIVRWLTRMLSSCILL